MATKPTKENVVRLFEDPDAELPEAAIDVSHLAPRGVGRPAAMASQPVIDLTDRPKAVMAIGLALPARRHCCGGSAKERWSGMTATS